MLEATRATNKQLTSLLRAGDEELRDWKIRAHHLENVSEAHQCELARRQAALQAERVLLEEERDLRERITAQLRSAEAQLSRLSIAGSHRPSFYAPDALAASLSGLGDAARAAARALVASSQRLAASKEEARAFWRAVFPNEAANPHVRLEALWTTAATPLMFGSPGLHHPHSSATLSREEERAEFERCLPSLDSAEEDAAGLKRLRWYKALMLNELYQAMLLLVPQPDARWSVLARSVQCMDDTVLDALARRSLDLHLRICACATEAPISLVRRAEGAKAEPQFCEAVACRPTDEHEVGDTSFLQFMISPGLRVHDDVIRKCRVYLQQRPRPTPPVENAAPARPAPPPVVVPEPAPLISFSPPLPADIPASTALQPPYISVIPVSIAGPAPPTSPPPPPPPQPSLTPAGAMEPLPALLQLPRRAQSSSFLSSLAHEPPGSPKIGKSASCSASYPHMVAEAAAGAAEAAQPMAQQQSDECPPPPPAPSPATAVAARPLPPSPPPPVRKPPPPPKQPQSPPAIKQPPEAPATPPRLVQREPMLKIAREPAPVEPSPSPPCRLSYSGVVKSDGGGVRSGGASGIGRGLSRGGPR